MIWNFFASILIFMEVHSSPTRKNSAETGPGLHTLTYLGTVEGKTFFVDNNATGGWNQNSLYCESVNMKIASFHTSAQLWIVTDAIGQEVLTHTSYWTSGQEIAELGRFAWTNGVAAIDSEVVKLSGFQPPKQYCLYLRTNESTTDYVIGADNCLHTGKTLCEIS